MTAPHELTDVELLARTRAGDTAAYEALYRRHVGDTRRVAALVTRSVDEADEVVSEAFARVLALLRRGTGPEHNLTPYLRTIVRRLAIDRYRATWRGGVPADPVIFETIPGPSDPVDLATTRDMVRQAYETLPAQWQKVLWRTEVEGQQPAAVAIELDSTPNAVAALAYRAREGLRQAYLKMHIAGSPATDCKPYVTKITGLLRGSLSPDDERAVMAHLGECAACRERRDEMLILVSDMRTSLVPALLGFVSASGSAAGIIGTAGAGGAVAGESASLTAARRLRPRGSSLAAGVTAAAAGTAVAVAMVTGMLGGTQDAGTADEPAAAMLATEDASPVPRAQPGSEPTAGETAAATAEPVEPVSEAVSGTAPQVGDDMAGDSIEALSSSETEPATRATEPTTRAPGDSTEETGADVAADPQALTEATTNPDPGRAREPEAEPTAEPEPPAEPEPTAEPDPDPGSGQPPTQGQPWWLCSTVPVWPGCPDDPQWPPSELLCARTPDLPFCDVGPP